MKLPPMPVYQKSSLNRKRRSSLVTCRAWIVRTAVALTFLSGCAPSTKPVGPAIPSPIQSEDVTPAADASSREATLLRQRVNSLSNSAGGLRGDLAKTRAEMDRLKAQKSATEQELDALWDMFTKSQEAAQRLFAEVEEAQKQAEVAEAKAAALVRASIEKDREVKELREQNAYLKGELAKAQDNEKILQGKLLKAEKKAAVAEYYTKLAVIVLVVGLLAFVAYFLIKVLPSIVSAVKPL